MKHSQARFDDRWPIVGIFAACLIWAAAMGSVGWNNGLSLHGFRQSQTAITSYYLAKGGPFFRYETPIFGAPWSVPFEFPLYQWIVSVVTSRLHLPLESAGRAVSECFYWLSLIVVFGILSELRIRPVHRLVCVTLVLASPQYIYWPRTFMMESTAVFFCVAYLYFIFRYIRTNRVADALVGGMLGTLGALVKLTTFPAFALVGGWLVLASIIRRRRDSRQGWEFLTPAGTTIGAWLVLFCAPVLVTWMWVRYTDGVKALNIIADGHLNSGSLYEWNFGTLPQRFSASTWKRLLSLTIPELSGHLWLLAIPCAALLFVRSKIPSFLLSMGGFLSAFLIFTNLHVLHDYYSYANGMFFIAAVSFPIVGLLEGNRPRQYVGLGIFLLCILSSADVYYARFHRYQLSEGRTYANVASVIREATNPSAVLLVFQNDWSPELVYYAERRALMWPGWMEQRIESPRLQEAVRRLGPDAISAAVFCDQYQAQTTLIDDAAKAFRLSRQPYFADGQCTFLNSATGKAPPRAMKAELREDHPGPAEGGRP